MDKLDKLPCYDASCFIWNGNVGSIEASDLGIERPHAEFNVRSHRTGRVVKFVHKHDELDRENEVVAHVYHAGEIIIRIFND